MLPVIRKACDILGGPPKLAATLGVKRQALYQWPRVPAERVLPIEAATRGKVRRHEMRPDLYPVEESVA